MRALLLSHGNYSQALLDGAREICAFEADIQALSNAGLGREELRRTIADWLGESKEPALLLVDAGGGSCGIAARLATRDFPRARVLGGCNLPMVLCFLTSHDELNLEDMVEKLIARGRADIDDLAGGALG